MIRLLSMLLLGTCGLCATALAQDYEALRAAVVKVRSQGEQGPQTGTGFIVKLAADSVYIVTAAHVVAGAQQVQVEFFTRRNAPVPARTSGREERNDLALLEVHGNANIPAGLSTLPLSASRGMRSGDELVCIGFPEGGGQWVVSKATFGDIVGTEFTLSGAIDAGSSGSPVIRNGAAVGVVTNLERRFARAAPSEIVEVAVQGWGVTLSKPPEPQPAPVPQAPPTQESKIESPQPLSSINLTGEYYGQIQGQTARGEPYLCDVVLVMQQTGPSVGGRYQNSCGDQGLMGGELAGDRLTSRTASQLVGGYCDFVAQVSQSGAVLAGQYACVNGERGFFGMTRR